MMIYNTDTARVEYYLPDDWSSIQSPFAQAHSCTAALDCASEICVDGYCCDIVCTGTCNRCNVVGSLGTCTEVASDCTGNCDVCSAGNCEPNASLCTGNCVTCSGSGTNYSCTANAALCTGNCDVCSGSGTAYSCAANDTVCSSNTSSCGCEGSGTVFNCASCPDTYGVCGTPTCSNYTCGNDTADFDNDQCATCSICSSGACVTKPRGTQGYGCTGCNYCSGEASCTYCYWITGAMQPNETVAGSSFKCTPATVGQSGYQQPLGCSTSAYTSKESYPGATFLYRLTCTCN